MVQSGTNSAARPLRTGRVGRLLGLLCVVAPILVAEARGTLPARAVATRFSSLSELTPRNVRGLMPLAVLPLEVGPPDDATGTDPAAPGRAARLGSLAAGDERLRGFVSWRVALNGGGAAVSTGSHDNGVAVSLVAAPASAAGLSGMPPTHASCGPPGNLPRESPEHWSPPAVWFSTAAPMAGLTSLMSQAGGSCGGTGSPAANARPRSATSGPTAISSWPC